MPSNAAQKQAAEENYHNYLTQANTYWARILKDTQLPLYAVFFKLHNYQASVQSAQAKTELKFVIYPRNTIDSLEFNLIFNDTIDYQSKLVREGILTKVASKLEPQTTHPLIAELIPHLSNNYFSNWMIKTNGTIYKNIHIKPFETKTTDNHHVQYGGLQLYAEFKEANKPLFPFKLNLKSGILKFRAKNQAQLFISALNIISQRDEQYKLSTKIAPFNLELKGKNNLNLDVGEINLHSRVDKYEQDTGIYLGTNSLSLASLKLSHNLLPQTLELGEYSYQKKLSREKYLYSMRAKHKLETKTDLLQVFFALNELKIQSIELDIFVQAVSAEFIKKISQLNYFIQQNSWSQNHKLLANLDNLLMEANKTQAKSKIKMRVKTNTGDAEIVLNLLPKISPRSKKIAPSNLRAKNDFPSMCRLLARRFEFNLEIKLAKNIVQMSKSAEKLRAITQDNLLESEENYEIKISSDGEKIKINDKIWL